MYSHHISPTPSFPMWPLQVRISAKILYVPYSYFASLIRDLCLIHHVLHIIMSVTKQRPGKQNSTIEILFSMGSALRQLLCNGSVNTFQQSKTVFSLGSVQRSYLKNKRRYGSVLSSEFLVRDSHGKFIEDP
jgi:hypothetical protein